jgi:hypothetical protein
MICYMPLAPKYIVVVYNNAILLKNICKYFVFILLFFQTYLGHFYFTIVLEELFFIIVHSTNVKPTILLIILVTLL